jgi:acetyl-CoA C-acetyltransferase
MSKVYVVSAKRTALGSFLGSLKSVSDGDLGAAVIKAVLAETKLDPKHIDEIIMGNILPAGQGQGIARQASIKAGVPVSVPAYGVNMVCGSGMKSVMLGFTSIKAGLYNVVLAGGIENMSATPYLVPKEVRTGVKMGPLTMNDHMLTDALWDAFDGQHMGVTAENIATKYKISREAQEAFAVISQQRAIKAVDSGEFKDEIVPLTIKVGKEEMVFENDEYPNRKTDAAKLASLRPAFVKEGTVTAGTSSGINDGASVILLASEEAVAKYSLVPLVELVGIGQGGVEPSLMGLGPTPAIRQALKHAGLKIDQIDLFELNEAFAAQALGVVHELAEEHHVTEESILNKTNPNGGAIALGHPVGASGNRIIVTLVHEMLKRDLTYGLASLCIGGGMGTAVIFKKLK